MRWFILAIFCFQLHIAGATTIRRLPDELQFGSYRAIFRGEITGIHLTSYEDNQLGKDTVLIGSGNFVVYVVVDCVFAGKIDQAIQVAVGGTSGVPKLKAKGLFLFPEGAGFPFVIWSSNAAEYERRLKQVESMNHPANFSSKPTC